MPAIDCVGIIGRHRDLHHNGAELRTLGLRALGTVGVTIGMRQPLGPQSDKIGRLVQGILGKARG